MSLPFPFGLTLVPLATPTPIDTRDLVDANNQVQNARLIDISTKDYVADTNGHFVGQDMLKQQVYLSMLTEFNSSSQQGFGNQLFNIKLITPNIINQCNAYVKLALANLINNGSLTLNGVNVVNNGNGQIVLQIFWTDNTNAAAQTTNINMKKGQ